MAANGASMASINAAIGKEGGSKDTVIKDNYLDQNSLNTVKAMGRNKDPQALKEVAKKFEGMFVQQMLKSMRDASAAFSSGDMFSSDEVKFHQEMLDQQMVINLTSGKGIGLATSMYQQMLKMQGNKSNNEASSENAEHHPAIKQNLLPSIKPLANATTLPPELISRAATNNDAMSSKKTQTPEEFIAELMPFAEKAAAALNVKTDVILAQAALETGWGKHVLHDAQGNSSFNMFNIKKSSSWQGESVGVKSLEFKQGVAQQEHSSFKKYSDYLHSVTDYVELMKSPRYQQALSAGKDSKKYAEALQRSGYATDPNYANKIKQLLASDTIKNAVSSSTVAAIAPEITRG